MGVRIRLAEAGDLRPLAELARRTYVDAFGYSLLPSDLAAHIESKLSDSCFERYLTDDTFVLAEHDAHLVGFLQIGAARSDPLCGPVLPGDVELRRIYVLSGYQNRGIGRRLIDAALQEPVAKTARHIFLDVWEENIGARKLYERYGFTVIGKQLFKVQSGAEAGFDLIMVRRAADG